MSPSDAPSRREFLRSCARRAVTLGEVGVIVAGTIVVANKGLRRILTLGVTDRRLAPDAILPQTEQPIILFDRLQDGETLLGKRIRLCSEYGGVLMASVTCAEIAQQLQRRQEREITIPDVSIEVRSLHMNGLRTNDISVDRVDE